ncbi:RNA-binding protein [Histomonas meleagridis]|uniref:RNA-binding protein n=1 Tax=Histomonas meleagridis TaxID=135588 RepID=UPI00355A2E4F|nr:RNA-binding protein [Histomonas meleagridis]KAH0801670.1 RNA-binding protein [Histomonas meleagridis]
MTSNPTDIRFRLKFHKPHYQIFVGGVRYSAKEEEIRNLFSQFGKVISVIIPLSRSGYTKGCAYVTFTKEADAKEAIAHLDKTTFQGRTIYVEEKREYDENLPRIDPRNPDQPGKYFPRKKSDD